MVSKEFVFSHRVAQKHQCHFELFKNSMRYIFIVIYPNERCIVSQELTLQINSLKLNNMASKFLACFARNASISSVVSSAMPVCTAPIKMNRVNFSTSKQHYVDTISANMNIYMYEFSSVVAAVAVIIHSELRNIATNTLSVMHMYECVSARQS